MSTRIPFWLLWSVSVFFSVFGSAVEQNWVKIQENGSIKTTGEHVGDFNNFSLRSLSASEIELLYKVLRDYDSNILPANTDKPVIVQSAAVVMSPPLFDEKEHNLKLKLKLNFEWVDWRLNFSFAFAFTVPEKIQEKIWKPNISFEDSNLNMKKSNVHDIRIIVYPGGKIVHTSSLTLSVFCKVIDKNFPFDNSVCEVMYGSHAYDCSQLKFVWSRQTDFPLTFLEEALDPVAQYHFRFFQIFQGDLRSYNQKYSMQVLKLFVSRRPLDVIVLYMVPLGLLTIASWAPTFVFDNFGARIIAGSSILGITLTLFSKRPRPNNLLLQYDDFLGRYSYGCLVLVVGSLVHSLTVLILKERKLARQIKTISVQHEASKIVPVHRQISGRTRHFRSQFAASDILQELTVDIGVQRMESENPEGKKYKPTSARCNSAYLIVAPIVFAIGLLGLCLPIILKDDAPGSSWTPTMFAKIKKEERIRLVVN